VVRLENIIYHADKDKDIGEVEQTMGLESLLDNLEQYNKTSVLTLSGREFIDALSRINIIRNIPLQRHMKSLEEDFPLYCPMGNSRDHPTLFVYECTKCNGY